MWKAVADMGVEIGAQRIRKQQAVINLFRHIAIDIGAPGIAEGRYQRLGVGIVTYLLDGAGLHIGHGFVTKKGADCSAPLGMEKRIISGTTCLYEQPEVEPQVLHFMQVPLRTKVKLPHAPQLSPSKPFSLASAARAARV